MRGHIEGTEIYLSEDQLPAFTISAGSLSDPGKAKGSRSTTLRIISTPESKRVLGNEFMGGVPNPERPILRLTEGGSEVFNSAIIPVVHNRNEIECVAVGGNATWFEFAKETVLNEFDFGTSLVPNSTINEITDSWTDETKILYFGIVDYGNITWAGVPVVEINRMRPGIRVGATLNTVLGTIGYAIVPVGTAADVWGKLVVLTPGEIRREHYGGGIAATAKQSGVGGSSITDVDVAGAGLVLTEVLDTNNNFNFITDRYAAPFSGFMNVRYDGVGIEIVPASATIGDIFYLQLWNDTTGLPLATVEQVWDGVTDTIRWWGAFDNVPIVSGNEYYLSVHRNVGGYSGTLDEFGGGTAITFFPLGTGTAPEYTSYQGEYNTGDDPVDGAGFNSESPIRVHSAMPQMTVATLLTALANNQRFIYTTDPITKIINVWHETDYYKTPNQSDEFRDWSTRMDHTNAPEKRFNSYPRRIDFEFATDETDIALQEAIRLSPAPGFGNGFRKIEGALGDPVKISLPFAPTANHIIGSSTGMFVPYMAEFIPADDFDDPGRYDRTPRLLIADGMRTGSWKLITGGSTITEYPFCYFYRNDADGYAVPFDNALDAPYPLAIDTYWQYYLDTIRYGRTLEADLFIRDHELLNFNHGIPTLVDDGGGPAWYYVQEIRNHRFGKNVPTRCTLVPLPNMEVAFDAIPVVPFVVPANPFVCAGPGYGSFTLTGGTSLGTVKTSTGYASTRSGSGDIVLHGGGNPDSFFDVNVGAEGSYCLWASNGLKEKIGTLTHIDNENSYVTALDINGYAGLLSIDFEDNVSFSALIFSGNPLLEFVQLLDYDGSILDFSDNSNLGQLRCGASVSLSTVILAALNPASFIDLSGCALTAATVNAILANAVANGMTGGTIDLSGGTSAAPTGQGILDAIYLVDILGNTVDTN